MAAWCLVDTVLYELDRTEPAAIHNLANKNLASQKEELANRQFIEGLLAPPNLTPVHKLEYNIIFYRKHRPNAENYAHALL